MSYTALYRKWRPATFQDVKGQDTIVTTLKNQISAGRIGHAYLFCGTRGTGKTTIAKIFARAVNCEHPVDGAPCGECATCRSIESGTSINVIEIDAASNNGVDNIREIRDEVQYSPAEGKYRVYIIDEAHMLSAGAFNALLKTLEEPPSYVVFILATTEPHKIPVTVLSRCQRYDFRRITTNVLADRLQELAQYEQVDVEASAISYIAKKADGAMRDAISLLDQCIAFHLGETLTYEKVLAVLGAVDSDVFSRYLRYTLRQDTTNLLLAIEEIVMSGRELTQFVQDFVWYMRNLLLLKTSQVGSETLDLTREDWLRLQEESKMSTVDGLIRLIRLYSELQNQMRYATGKRVLLEVMAIKTTRPAMEENMEAILARLDALESKLKEGIICSQPTDTATTQNFPSKEPQDTVSKKEPVILPKAQWEDLMLIQKEWGKIQNSIEYLAKRSLEGCRLEPKKEGVLGVVFFDPFIYNMCNTIGALEQVKAFVSQAYGKTIEFEARLAGEPPVEETVYVSDEELSVIHAEIEFEED